MISVYRKIHGRRPGTIRRSPLSRWARAGLKYLKCMTNIIYNFFPDSKPPSENKPAVPWIKFCTAVDPVDEERRDIRPPRQLKRNLEDQVREVESVIDFSQISCPASSPNRLSRQLHTISEWKKWAIHAEMFFGYMEPL